MATARNSVSSSHLLFRILVAIGGICVGMLLMESGIRFFGPSWLRTYMHSVNLTPSAERFGTDAHWSVESVAGEFVRFTPNTAFRINYYEYNHEVHIDPIGARTNPYANPGATMIPFVGDSFTFGVGVPDSHTFVALLNRGLPYNFENLGVPGSALPQQLEIIRYRHKELGSPSIYVFVFFLGNDFLDLLHYYSRSNETPSVQSSRTGRWIDVLSHDRFLGKSYLLQFVNLKLFSPNRLSSAKTADRVCNGRSATGKRIVNPLFLIALKYKRCTDRARIDLDRSLDRLEEMSKDLHFTPYFLLIPDKVQIERDLLSVRASTFGFSMNDFDVSLPNQIVQQELTRRHIHFSDALPCLYGKAGLYYEIDEHFTSAGHDAFTACVQKDLKSFLQTHVR